MTARRHFYEMGLDPDKDEFTVDDLPLKYLYLGFTVDVSGCWNILHKTKEFHDKHGLGSTPVGIPAWIKQQFECTEIDGLLTVDTAQRLGGRPLPFVPRQRIKGEGWWSPLPCFGEKVNFKKRTRHKVEAR